MASEAVSSRERSTAIVLALVAQVFGNALGVAGSFAIPAFKSVFSAFGADLPLLTKLTINFSHFLWALPILAAVFWWLLPSNAARIKFYAIFCACELILVLLVLIALYSPIFRLGSVV